MQNEVSNITQLPYFIIFKIANYLRDTTSYNNFRLTSKKILECVPYARSFYESGSLYSSIKIYHNIPQSNKEIFFQNGNLQMSFCLRGFKYHGPFKELYETGNKKTTGCYYLNKKDGPFIQYYPNGLIALSQQYYRGKLDGASFEYHENGVPYFELYYKDGLRHGLYREFLSSGELIIEKKYKKGKIHGLYREWSNGILTILASYVYGKLENRWEEYYINGGLRVKKNYLDGKQHGNEIGYYSSGKIKYIKRFVLGKQNGIEKYYLQNGMLKYIERWKDGSKNGVSIYYSYNDYSRKIVEYFYDSIMYTCIYNKLNKDKKIEEYYTSIGQIKVHNLNHLTSIYIYTGTFSYEYEKVIDNNIEYFRLYFSELLKDDKETSLEYMVYRDIESQNQSESKSLLLNNRTKIIKNGNLIYYSIKSQ